MDEHVILVALSVTAPSREAAHAHVLATLPSPGQWSPHLRAATESWWVAEDDRTDGSDNDSAVFVPMGQQAELQKTIRHHY